MVDEAGKVEWGTYKLPAGILQSVEALTRGIAIRDQEVRLVKRA